MDRLPLDLREIRSFVAVAEMESFGGAAASLDIAQPSLSLRIQKLERELGVQLLRRSSRQVELTDAGRALLVESRALLAQAQVAVESVRLAGSGEIGTLRLGFYDTAPMLIMPRLLGHFRDRFPNVNFKFTELSSRDQLAAIARGDIDIGILRGPIAEERMESRCVAMETLLVALPERHPLAAREEIPIALLRDESFVLLPRSKGSGLYDEIIVLFHSNGFSPVVVQEANEMHTVCGLVAAGLGISIVPGSVRALHVRGIAYRPIAPLTRIHRCVAWLRESRSPALAGFVSMLPATPLSI